jgi:uncharacterized iron-regulated membrane protein
MSNRIAKRWPSLPTSVVQATLSGHSTFGLVAAALIYIVCLTGVPSVFAKELMRWEAHNAPIVETATIEAMARVLDSTLALAGPERDLYGVMVFAPEPDMPLLRGRAVGPDYERIWAFDARGENPVVFSTPASDFITVLHEDFHASTWGSWLVGISGAALFALVLSGLFAHPRIFRDAFKLRWGGSWRLQEADLHNRLSVWGAPFHLVIALTGAILGLFTLIGAIAALILSSGDLDRAGAILSGETATARPAVSTMADIHELTRRVEAVSDTTDVGFIYVSRAGRPDQKVFIDVVGHGELAGGQTYIVDDAGAVQRANGYLDGSFAQQWRGALIPLHYGSFGGLAIKIIYGLLGAGLCVIVSTGVTIWVARRRERGLAVPGWARIWIAVAWGQVAALTLAAAGAMLGAPALWVWLATGVLALSSAAIPSDARAFARIWRALAGASLSAPVAAHMAIHGWLSAGPALSVLAALLALAFGLIASALAGAALPPRQIVQLDANKAPI